MHNSFRTASGANVAGVVPMAVDNDGQAVPVTKDTAVGTVKLSQESVDALAKAIAVELRKEKEQP